MNSMPTFEVLSQTEWLEQYQPELDDKGQPRVSANPPPGSPQHIWTLCCSELDEPYLDPGVRITNNLGYVRCAQPWAHPNLQVQ